MRILHVIHSLDPRSGGPSNALRLLVAAQQRAGHQVSVLATDAQSAEPWSPPAEYRRMIAATPGFAEIDYFIGKGYGRLRPLRRFRFSPESERWLRNRLDSADQRPEVVHIHGLFSHVTISAARMCRDRRIPYVMRPAGGLGEYCMAQGNRLGKKLLYNMFVKSDLAGSVFIHATSFREKNELKTLVTATPIRVVPHGVTIPDDQEIATALAEFHLKYPQFAGKRFFIYLSRIAAKKRLDLLLRAVAEDWFAQENFNLVIAGPDAGYQAEAERLATRLRIRERVHFLGFIEGPLKMGALAAADLFILPSEDENFGLAAMEAMAHGTPVLLSTGVDSHHYSDTAKAGLTVEPDAKEVSKGIRVLLTEDLEAMGRRGREYAREHLCWDHISETLCRLYYGPVSNLSSEAIDLNKVRSEINRE
jgi:glycosyltransferase involved in cell wall biosynthesis